MSTGRPGISSRSRLAAGACCADRGVITALELHPSPLIEWAADGLPQLAQIGRRREAFDLVTPRGVWRHLDAARRERATPVAPALWLRVEP